MNNNKYVLFYGIDEEDSENLSKVLLKEYSIKSLILTEDMGKMKIKDIVEGLRIKVYNCNLPKEKMILFNNLNDKELNDAIDTVRDTLEYKVIFASVTSTSELWTFEYLLNHLVEERNWYETFGK